MQMSPDSIQKDGTHQLHIFMDPFYYIDYTLAQVAALQFLARMLDRDSGAFQDYLQICRLGGTLPFRDLMHRAHLQVPFEPGCLKDTAATLRQWFAQHMPAVTER